MMMITVLLSSRTVENRFSSTQPKIIYMYIYIGNMHTLAAPSTSTMKRNETDVPAQWLWHTDRNSEGYFGAAMQLFLSIFPCNQQYMPTLCVHTHDIDVVVDRWMCIHISMCVYVYMCMWLCSFLPYSPFIFDGFGSSSSLYNDIVHYYFTYNSEFSSARYRPRDGFWCWDCCCCWWWFESNGFILWFCI